MMVLHLTSCPTSLRGDLTKWLIEIAAGVYVGRVSARVRDKLWERVIETCKGGRAVLVYSTNNEQRMDFRVHGETWEAIDFDGLKLMLRPNPTRLMANQAKRGQGKKTGFSNASKYRAAKRRTLRKSDDILVQDIQPRQQDYVIIDVETTGLNPDFAEIIELGAIKVLDSKIADTFQSFVKIDGSVPSNITDITGISNKMIQENGRQLTQALYEFITFIGDFTLVAHNAPFDMKFLNAGLNKTELKLSGNKVVDTLEMARRLVKRLPSYKLSALATHFVFDAKQSESSDLKMHRSLGDCNLVYLLYEKLMDLDGLGL